jgi:general secretion pathway protein F
VSSVMPEATQDLALFHRTLSALCRSEVPLPNALRVIETDLESSPLRDAVREMAADVESGTPIAEAYAAHAQRFPPLYRALVEAGAASGDLPAVLEQIADHATQRGEIASKLRRALAYPMVAAVFLLVTGTLLLVFVAPKFVELSHTVSPGMIDGLSGRDGTGRAWGARPWLALEVWMGLVLVLALVTVVFTRLRDPMDGAASGGATRYRFPVLGRVRYHADLAAFTSTLALLVRRRMPLPRALDLAAEVTEAGPLRRSALAAADAAHEGRGLADAARHAGLFAPSLLWIVEAAERRGDAAAALDDLTAIHRQRLARCVDRAAVLVTPVAELVVGVAVLLLAYAFLSPLFDFTRKVFGG